MGDPIETVQAQTNTKHSWTLRPYLKTQAGTIILPKGYDLPYASENIGLKLSNGKTYFEAEAGAGTAVAANLSFGHEFNIGKNLGLELSANGSYVNDLIKTDISVNMHNNINYSESIYINENLINTYECNYNLNHTYDFKYAKSNASATGKATLNWHPNDKLTFKAGGYAGVRASCVPTVDAKTTYTIDTNIDDHIADEGYITTITNLGVNNEVKVGEQVVTPVAGGSFGVSGKRFGVDGTIGTDGVTIGAKINLGRNP